MLDHHDREKFAAIYRLLAEVLEHERQAGVSYSLGDLAGRVFIGLPAEPPDEVLEAVARALRSGGAAQRRNLAERLRSHAQQLERGPE